MGEHLIYVIVALVIGIFMGLIPYIIALITHSRAVQKSEEIISAAKKEAEILTQEMMLKEREKINEMSEKLRQESESAKREIREAELRIQKREDLLDRESEVLAKKELDLHNKEKELSERGKKIEDLERKFNELIELEKRNLQEIAHLDREKAKELLLAKIKEELSAEVADYIEKAKQNAKEQAEREVKQILTESIQRYAAGHTAEMVISTIDLPNDDIKGRIIGKDGRNIRAFEQATGVNVIIDDTPGVVVLSSFDNIRREIARIALTHLIADGRIHPARIEEVVDLAKKELESNIYEVGKKTCYELKLHDINSKLFTLIGRLKYRTSYGQNVLTHSIETAYLAERLADELGLNPILAKRCGLLHDIGKAVDQELEGGHSEVGAEVLKRFKELNDVVDAALNHHNDTKSRSPYTVVVATADAISASRPGARRESVEKYIKRLERLEAIVTSFEGVSSAYAVHAGREIRVIVNPDVVDDNKALILARDIANQIEKELKYPGEIKVTLLRERRVIEYAR